MKIIDSLQKRTVKSTDDKLVQTEDKEIKDKQAEDKHIEDKELGILPLQKNEISIQQHMIAHLYRCVLSRCVELFAVKNLAV